MNDQDRKIPPKVGDLIIWKDGTVGVLVERYDLYAKAKIASRRSYSPCWSWRIFFPNDPPDGYNIAYGESEVNIKNRNNVKTIVPC